MPVPPDDLPAYVVGYYSGCMREDEFQEWRNLTIEGKELMDELFSAYGSRREEHRRYLTEDGIADARWQAYCERRRSFYKRTSERILKDHDVFLNRCPYCGSLARTPRARQCGKCYRRWDKQPF